MHSSAFRSRPHSALRCGRSHSAALRWYLQLEPIVAHAAAGQGAGADAASAARGRAASARVLAQSTTRATVSSAVDATRRLRQPRAAAMINALLRRYLREREVLRARILADGEAATAHPAWLLAALRATYPDRWREIIVADNAHPPMTLRVDRSADRAGELSRAPAPPGLLCTPGVVARDCDRARCAGARRATCRASRTD